MPAQVLKDLNGGVPVKDSVVDSVWEIAWAVTQGSVCSCARMRLVWLEGRERGRVCASWHSICS